MRERAYEIYLFIPVLWDCVTWDYSSLYKIMEHWLSRMEQSHINDKLHTRNLERAEQIKQAKLVCKRLHSDSYTDGHYAEHDKRWGKSRHWFTPVNDGSGNSQMHFKRRRVKNDKDQEIERKEFLQLMYLETYLFNQDVEYLATLLRKHSKGWWT